MVSKIVSALKRFWWVSFLIVVGGWIIYLAINCHLWPNGCTGFEGKTVWEVLELLIIPVTLAGIATYLDKLERKADRENFKDNQREALLQNYIEFMTKLVLEKGLRKSKPGDEVRNIAQTKTRTTYERLDSNRNGALVKFLVSLGLVQSHGDNLEPTIGLEGIELDKAKLGGIDMRGAILTGARLNGAILSEADLRSAHLVRANLSAADLSSANLSGADLSSANLSGANLWGADFQQRRPKQRNPKWGKLMGRRPEWCKTKRSRYLYGAGLTRANLSHADLSRAFLIGAILEETMLDGATMPDGKVYDPNIHKIEELTRKQKAG